MSRPLVYLVGLLIAAFAAGIGVARIGDDDPVRQPVAAEIKAAVVVDAAAVEMRGYDQQGRPGKWIYDCEATEDPKPGEPTIVCTQREQVAAP